MLRPVVLSVLLLSGGLVACDSGGPGDERLPRTSTYATDGTDLAQATAALPDGGLVVGGIAEGRIAPTDGTIAYPLVLRFDEAGLVAGATVYRDGEPDFGGVAGVAPLDDGLAVLVRRDGALVLYRTDRDGRDRRVLFRPPATFAPEGTLLRTHDGGLVFAVYPEVAEADAVFKVTEDGELAWSYRMAGAQDVYALAEAPDGTLYALGRKPSGEGLLARLSPAGEERWRTELSPARLHALVALSDGVVVLGDEYIGGEEVRVVRLDGAGSERWQQTVASGRAVWSTALAALPDGELAVGIALDDTPDTFGQSRAEVVTLSARGAVVERFRFGHPDSTSYVEAIVPLVGGRVAVVGNVGPARLGGYGGDDFDVQLAFLDGD